MSSESSSSGSPNSASGSPTPAQERQSAFTTWIIVGVGVAALIRYKPELAQTIGVFILMLSVLVFVHEWGHYQFARWAGMKVNRFGIGFPPWIYTRRYKGIDYSLGALPIGGMVNIAGLGSEEEMLATAAGDEVAPEKATRAARADVPHGHKQFQDASLLWRFWVLFAGPMMNFVFALVVFIGLFSVAGMPVPINRIGSVGPGVPAATAGLKPNDVIVAINGHQTGDFMDIRQQILDSGGQPITVTVQRASQTLQIVVRPVLKGTTPFIGIGASNETIVKRFGLAEATKRGCESAVNISTQILSLVGHAVTFRLTKEEARDVGGPVKIAQVAGEAARSGWLDYLALSAALSVNLGLLNLLPFPALDGGRILFLGFELIAGKPIDPRKEGLVHMVGMVMLLAFMLFITVRDVWPWIQQNLQKVF